MAFPSLIDNLDTINLGLGILVVALLHKLQVLLCFLEVTDHLEYIIATIWSDVPTTYEELHRLHVHCHFYLVRAVAVSMSRSNQS